MTPEAKASQIVRLRASEWGTRLFRNNNGMAYSPTGQPIFFGLGNEGRDGNKVMKSSDFIGVTPILITPEMVGKTIGVFTSIEVKPEGFKIRDSYNPKSREYAQDKWNQMVRMNHGIAGFASDAYQLDMIISNFINGMKQ